MNTLLANSAIIIAIVALLTELAHAVAALTNWLNARTATLEMRRQIAALQAKQIDLAAAQGTAAASPPAAATPLVIGVPLAPLTGPTGPVGPGGPPGVPPS